MRETELKDLWRSHAPGLLGRRYACAVLCPFVARQDGLHLLFEVRAETLRRQPGEVCFPGGRMDGGESAVQCALRETEEELSIPAAHVEVFGQADFLCLPGRFSLQPVLGMVDAAGFAAMRPNPAEVGEVFTVPLDFFFQTPPQVYAYQFQAVVPEAFPYDAVDEAPTYRWGAGEAEVPIWRWEGHPIWGMTGRIVKHLIESMGQAGWRR